MEENPQEQNLSRRERKWLNIISFAEVGLLEVFFAGLALILFFGTLNYFNILPLSRTFPLLSSLPQNQTQPPSRKPKATPDYLYCPFGFGNKLCKEGVSIKYKNNPAIAWKAPVGTKILSVSDAVDSSQFVGEPYTTKSPRGLYQSFISGNYCYTLTYTLPNNTILESISLLPLEPGVNLALASGNSVFTNTTGQDFSLILQMQRREIRSKTGEPEFLKCATTNLKSSDFGEYQKLNINNFH